MLLLLLVVVVLLVTLLCVLVLLLVLLLLGAQARHERAGLVGQQDRGSQIQQSYTTI